MRIIIIAAALSLLPTSVAAHGDAAWIMTNGLYSWCCGPKDCKEETVTETSPGVYQTTDGYVFKEGDKGLFWTDAKHQDSYWVCRESQTGDEGRDFNTGRPRCLFRPEVSF